METVIKASIALNLQFVVELETGAVTVRACDAQVLKIQTDDLVQVQNTEHTIGPTEDRYGILTLGVKSAAGRLLPIATEIAIHVDGQEVTNCGRIATHKSARGRIDGLTNMYRQHHQKLYEGAIVDVTYDAETSVLSITTK